MVPLPEQTGTGIGQAERDFNNALVRLNHTIEEISAGVVGELKDSVPEIGIKEPTEAIVDGLIIHPVAQDLLTNKDPKPPVATCVHIVLAGTRNDGVRTGKVYATAGREEGQRADAYRAELNPAGAMSKVSVDWGGTAGRLNYDIKPEMTSPQAAEAATPGAQNVLVVKKRESDGLSGLVVTSVKESQDQVREGPYYLRFGSMDEPGIPLINLGQHLGDLTGKNPLVSEQQKAVVVEAVNEALRLTYGLASQSEGPTSNPFVTVAESQSSQGENENRGSAPSGEKFLDK